MVLRYRHVLSRRTLLRGAGSIAIGLPLLEEMSPTSVWAAPPEPPARSITIFFGEGFPVHVQEDHLPTFSGPLEPLGPISSKLGFVRGLSFPQMGGAHEAGGMCPFVGVPFVDLNRAGGPSLDQVLLQELYAGGLPAAMIPTLSMGFFGSYRDSGDYFRRIKSWKNDGSPAELPKAYPSELFTRIFGGAKPLDDGGSRRARSVLDSVIKQYQSLTGPASQLGAASRSRISDHLDRIREYEVRAFGDGSGQGCVAPMALADPPLFKGQQSFAGVNLGVQDLSNHWRMNVDLFTLALQCDMSRIGVAHFLNVGDRIDLRGDYEYEGRLIYSFDDTRDRGGKGTQAQEESNNVNHEHYHEWDNPGQQVAAHHLHFYMREVAYLLAKLNDPAFTDENGGTLLDNAMLLMTTELSAPGAHLVNNMIHMVGSANGRFKTGAQIISAGDGSRPAVDLYNTVLRAYGVMNRTMGESITTGEISQILS